jgi:hypothetical protein
MSMSVSVSMSVSMSRSISISRRVVECTRAPTQCDIYTINA